MFQGATAPPTDCQPQDLIHENKPKTVVSNTACWHLRIQCLLPSYSLKRPPLVLCSKNLSASKIKANYFTSIMGLFENSGWLQFRTYRLQQNCRQVRKQRRELLIYRGKGELEELLQTKCPLEYTGGLKRNGFSLAELWPSHWLGYCQARR